MDLLVNHALRGALFETWVLSELLKKRYNAGQPSNLYFWRDRTGNEIDILADLGSVLVPLEIKSGRTVTQAYFKGLKRWLSLAGDSAKNPRLIYAGDKSIKQQGIEAVPWREVAKLDL